MSSLPAPAVRRTLAHKSEILLDFVLAEIGPSIYNQAITDAQHFIEESAADMASACDRAEFPYWVKPGRAR